MAENTNKIYYCPMELALDLIGGKWKPPVSISITPFGVISKIVLPHSFTASTKTQYPYAIDMSRKQSIPCPSGKTKV